MAWKTVVVKRLVARNDHEANPLYGTLFSLLDQKGRDVTAAQDETRRQVAATAAVVEKEELYRAAAAKVFEVGQENKELRSSLELAKAQLEDKKMTLEQTQIQNAKLEADLLSIRARNEELETAIEPLRVSLEEKNSLICDLEKQMEQLRQENDRLKVAHETALGECSALREISDTYQQKLLDERMESSRLQALNNRLSLNHSGASSTSSLDPSREASPSRQANEPGASISTLTDRRSTIAVVPSTPTPSINVKNLATKVTAFFRSPSMSSESSNGHFSRSHAGSDSTEFQFVAIQDLCPVCSYPTKVSHEFEAHEGECSAVKWSPMGRYLATAGSDRTIKLWAIESFGLPASLGITINGCPQGILNLEFDTTEAHVAAACADRTARIYRISTKKETHVLSGHTDPVTAVRFGGSGQAGIATSSRDGTIRLWDSNNCYVTRTIFFPSRCNDLVVLTGGGLAMASGHANHKVCFWDHRAESSKPIAEVEVSEKVTSLDVIATSPFQLLAMTKDSTLHMIDCRKNRVSRTFTNEGFIINSEYARAVISPDSQYVCAGSMVGSQCGSLHVWNSQTGAVVSTIKREHDPAPIVAVAWQPSGRYIASVDKKRRCTLFADM